LCNSILVRAPQMDAGIKKDFEAMATKILSDEHWPFVRVEFGYEYEEVPMMHPLAAMIIYVRPCVHETIRMKMFHALAPVKEAYKERAGERCERFGRKVILYNYTVLVYNLYTDVCETCQAREELGMYGLGGEHMCQVKYTPRHSCEG
jgi:hypothetical protein